MTRDDIPPSLSDDAFLEAFRSGALPLEAFTHESHLRLGWLHLLSESKEEAIESVVREIRHYVSVHGKEDKYHHTLTVAAMHVLAQRMGSSEVRTFSVFLQKNPDLLSDLKGLVLRHYSPERLRSSQAASAWIEPDLLPF